MKQKKVHLPTSLQGKFIALVGLMGSGKTRLGRIIASTLNLPFIDTDTEIEKASGYTIQEIFERFDENYFRTGERRVIHRILSEKPAILATGGGAYMNPETRKRISKKGLAIWLRADLDILIQRTNNRNNRPLLTKGNKRKILSQLMIERYPVYSKAEIVVDVSDEPAKDTALRIIETLINHVPSNLAHKKDIHE